MQTVNSEEYMWRLFFLYDINELSVLMWRKNLRNWMNDSVTTEKKVLWCWQMKTVVENFELRNYWYPRNN